MYTLLEIQRIAAGTVSEIVPVRRNTAVSVLCGILYITVSEISLRIEYDLRVYDTVV